MDAQMYEVRVRPVADHDGGGFLALVPELPGCMSDGETPQAAITKAYDAIACWIECAQEDGRPVPPARGYVTDDEI